MQNLPAEPEPYDPRPEAARWKFAFEEKSIDGRTILRSAIWLRRLRDISIRMSPPYSSSGFRHGYEFIFGDGSKLRISMQTIEAV